MKTNDPDAFFTYMRMNPVIRLVKVIWLVKDMKTNDPDAFFTYMRMIRGCVSVKYS